jgi:hypothetical protein
LAAAVRFAFGFGVGFALVLARAGLAATGGAAGGDAAEPSVAACTASLAACTASLAAGGRRFSLRRCGRVRGRPPRTSDGRSSLIGSSMIAHVARTRRPAPQAAVARRRYLLGLHDDPRILERNLKRSGTFLVSTSETSAASAAPGAGWPASQRLRWPAPTLTSRFSAYTLTCMFELRACAFGGAPAVSDPLRPGLSRRGATDGNGTRCQ